MLDAESRGFLEIGCDLFGEPSSGPRSLVAGC
jgi:hypothetical protein